MPRLRLCAMAGAALLSVALSTQPVAADSCATDSAAQVASKPKKKGLALGGLLSAARRAGVGDMLAGRAGNILGDGRTAQVAGMAANAADRLAETAPRAGADKPAAACDEATVSTEGWR